MFDESGRCFRVILERWDIPVDGGFGDRSIADDFKCETDVSLIDILVGLLETSDDTGKIPFSPSFCMLRPLFILNYCLPIPIFSSSSIVAGLFSGKHIVPYSLFFACPDPPLPFCPQNDIVGQSVKKVLLDHFDSYWEFFFHSAELYIIGTFRRLIFYLYLILVKSRW